MSRKAPLFMLGGAVLVMLLAVVALMHYSSPHHPAPTKVAAKKAQPKPKPKVFVLALGPNVSAGSLLQPGQIISKPVLNGKIKPGQVKFSQKNEESFYGSMLRKSAPTGTALTESMVIKPGQSGFLAAVLKPGMRAMTIPVDQISDSSGLIWPGDHVDVMLLQSLPSQLQAGHNLAAETALGNVEIIAAGSAIVPPSGPHSNGTMPVRTVTLEVTPGQAKRLALDEHLGSMYLTLRSARTPKVDPPSTELTWAYQASPAITASDANDVTVFSDNTQQGYTVP